MRHIIKNVALGGASLSLFALAGVHAQDTVRAYYANDPVGRNVVTIQSLAPLETMVTTTGDIKADIAIDPSNVLKNPRARFEINMDSLDTGIALRNEHMRGEAWLDTKKFPKATFVLTKVLAPTGKIPLQQGKTASGTVEGDLTVHGVTRKVRAGLTINTIAGSDKIKRLDGDMMHIRASFPLKLADFGINVPAPAQAEIAPVQNVTVDVFSSTGSENPNLTDGNPTANAAGENKGNVKKMANGLIIEDVTVGDGAEAVDGKKVTVHYRGTLTNGKQFDASYDRAEPFEFDLGAGQVIKGWDQGVKGMKVGGKRKLTIPAELGYGPRAMGRDIPANSTLLFDVELLKVS